MSTNQSNSKKKKETIRRRQIKEKTALLEHLKKMPVVQVACERAGLSRATYYRWCGNDEEFEKNSQEAMFEGEQLLNDMGEAQMVTLIKDKHWPAIKYWLEKHHTRYLPKTDTKNSRELQTKIILLHDNED